MSRYSDYHKDSLYAEVVSFLVDYNYSVSELLQLVVDAIEEHELRVEYMKKQEK